MNRKCLSLIFAGLIVLLSAAIGLCFYKQEGCDLVIKGTVVAYLLQTKVPAIDADLARGEFVVIRVNKVIKGKETSRYLIGVYQYNNGQTNLQKDILEGRAQARFALTRQLSCDKSLVELEPALGSKTKDAPEGTVLLYTPPLVRSPDANNIPPKLQLPCYVFGPSDLKVIKR